MLKRKPCDRERSSQSVVWIVQRYGDVAAAGGGGWHDGYKAAQVLGCERGQQNISCCWSDFGKITDLSAATTTQTTFLEKLLKYTRQGARMRTRGREYSQSLHAIRVHECQLTNSPTAWELFTFVRNPRRCTKITREHQGESTQPPREPHIQTS